jgi:hypothetical protein
MSCRTLNINAKFGFPQQSDSLPFDRPPGSLGVTCFNEILTNFYPFRLFIHPYILVGSQSIEYNRHLICQLRHPTLTLNGRVDSPLHLYIVVGGIPFYPFPSQAQPRQGVAPELPA